MKDASITTNRKDYTKRANVIRFLPWWLNKINSLEWNLEHALSLLKAGKTIKYINDKDRKGLIQALEAHFELANIPS